MGRDVAAVDQLAALVGRAAAGHVGRALHVPLYRRCPGCTNSCAALIESPPMHDSLKLTKTAAYEDWHGFCEMGGAWRGLLGFFGL